MFFICKYKNLGTDININGAYLVNDNETFKMEFKHLTKKGYQSTKPLFADFEYSEVDGELHVCDAIAETLIKKYANVVPKIFETNRQQHENSLQAYSDALKGINVRWGDKRPY